MIAPGKFSAGAVTRQISRWEFELLESLAFDDPIHGQLTVPVGFVCDLASIRILREICRWASIAAVIGALFAWGWVTNLCWLVAVGTLALYSLVAGYGMRAAILHDWLYTVGWFTRSQSDAIYGRALRTGDGTARWRVLLFWAGVRVGGAKRYAKASAL